MFNSGVKVAELIEQIQNEVDIAIDVDLSAILQSYNGLIAGLYRDIVREECEKTYMLKQKSDKKTADWTTVEYSSENVYRVYTEDFYEAEKVNPTYAMITDRVCWFPSGEKEITLKNFPGEKCIVISHAVPAVITSLKKTDDEGKESEADIDSIVPVPVDFIDMVKAKIRGDMYNISNDDDLAAKWYGIYNSRIEDFKMFVSGNKAEVTG